MTRRITNTVAPCLRSLRGRHPVITKQWVPTVAGFSTATPYQYAAAAATRTTAFPGLHVPNEHIPSTKVPSARPVENRKAQLIRTYTSLLRSTPLMLLFQHNNLTAVEWAAVRRELKKALVDVPAMNTSPGAEPLDLAPKVQMQVLRTNMFKVALRITELYNAEAAAALETTPSSPHGPLVHDLSTTAYETIKNTPTVPGSAVAQLEPLMVGPLAALVLPALSTAHLAAALSVLSPVPGKFPAPSRKKNPGYYDPIFQEGLSKLLLVGGRIEGKVFDHAGINWVGGIEGGLDGLRAQLVGLLQGAGLGITSTLEGGSRSLWLALEGRKTQLEEEQNPKTEQAE
ncbi:hypothetical protein B0I35DRAFT_358068 [Stachybotrys elegans]|uniref:Ribosomal protein YmL11, mitochondrial n=1 Tax=Stachybotrys elegans TaxID=80388 RepID=A0A8K0SN29_9HYPO|nr:hypothetical protein B0I35DRAFT_358068 [Stachybotrys elegans]